VKINPVLAEPRTISEHEASKSQFPRGKILNRKIVAKFLKKIITVSP